MFFWYILNGYARSREGLSKFEVKNSILVKLLLPLAVCLLGTHFESTPPSYLGNESGEKIIVMFSWHILNAYACSRDGLSKFEVKNSILAKSLLLVAVCLG